MKTSLHILERLREYEMEIEECKLHERQVEEDRRRRFFEEASGRVRRGLELKAQAQMVGDFLRADGYAREASAEQEICLRNLALAQRERMRQVESVLQAKRRLDMVDRILQHRLVEERIQMDYQERKQLDDFGQTQFVRARQEEEEVA